MPPRRSKRAAGRPRLPADSSAATLPLGRRDQIRRAQRTYRQKKEAVFRDATARAERLESTMRAAVEELAALSELATAAQLHLSHAEIHTGLVRLRELLNTGETHSAVESRSSSTRASPGSIAERQETPVFDEQIQSTEQYRYAFSARLLGGQYTYAFQESSFARQLQRYCLEHAYRLLFAKSSQADPQEIYRVFRLVPCVQNPGKTEPRFRQLLMGGCTDPLELLGLPFYRIGGAGTHFPDPDADRATIYPVNSRMPRRILGIARGSELKGNEAEQALGAYGLGGEWFDCRDVEGYLRQNGVDVKQGLFPTQHISRRSTEDGNTLSYTLDVEGLFSRLISRVVILGRAPGFRKADVERALRASQIAIERIDGDCYRSVVPPICMGDLANWAYGGNILAIAINAAYETVTPDQHLYSISGHFLRPASPSQKLICRVERIRDTRTFQTRHLRIVQCAEDTEQLCLVATADFHIDEPAHAVMVNYSARPQLAVPSTPPAEAKQETTRERGLYSILDTMMDVRPHGNRAEPQNDPGKGVAEIVTGERFRIHMRGQLQREADRIAALAFYMDRGLAYIPANHSGYSLTQASACATLDFVLRLLTPRVNLRDWHVSERQACAAGNARAVSEGRVFNGDGQLLASMTQTTILRAKTGASRI
ncbi:thioesterase-like superfamily-domain-containing protein [Aspergillus pseudoustus]|uniref:Thioesterase-like superfamily-domain-containing protein n=1 Tax=Aspergillus pseudoustus TaxID=1810923 RepID=A0ABR4JK39_9EURO